MEARAVQKTYRLRQAIRQLEEEVKTNPARKPALEIMETLLKEWQRYVPKK
jgi:hypothetical protein